MKGIWLWESCSRRWREPCGPFAPERAWVFLGSPCYICICFVSYSCWWMRPRCDVCPQTAVMRWGSHLLGVKPTGLLHKNVLVRVVSLWSLWTLWCCRASLEISYSNRLFNSWRLSSVTSSAAAGELGCALGRERRKDAAGKGSCAETGCDALLTKNRVLRRFVLLC